MTRTTMAAATVKQVHRYQTDHAKDQVTFSPADPAWLRQVFPVPFGLSVRRQV